jgi:predicted Zn finger-like uncharacterized protein
LIITCPQCKTRYRVDAAALTRPGGRNVRCAACGHRWHLPPGAPDPSTGEPAKIDLPPLEPPPLEPELEPSLALPPRPDPVMPTPYLRPVETLPRGRRWLTVGLWILVALIVLGVIGALIFAR